MNALTRCFNPLLRGSLLALALLCGPAAQAHQGSEGYVQLTQTADGARLQVDAALRDLDLPLQLDDDGNGQLTTGEVNSAWPRIDGYVKAHVKLDGCELIRTGQTLVTHDQATYASLAYDARCPQGLPLAKPPALRYTLFKTIDTGHRATARIEWAGSVSAQLLNPQDTPDIQEGLATIANSVPQDPEAGTTSSTAESGPFAFVTQGVHHIVTGYDHLLFLLCLLLPSVMRREQGTWKPVERLSQALWPVLGIVTAFTLAHSVTLTLAALKWVSLPDSLVEPLIAFTIAVAALDNLRPVLGRRRVLMTFLFGLIHGFGFAGVLQELDLPTSAFASALLQFNLGLELGQVGIVAAVTGLLFVLRQRQAYSPWVIKGGSLASIGMAALWFMERVGAIS